MGLSTRNFFGLVDDTQPVGTDSRTISDDQHREILGSLKQQCPNWAGVVTATHGDVNTLTGLAAGGVKPMPGQGGVTVLYAYNAATPPLGWTIEAPDANIRELVIGPEASGGTIGGTENPTNMSDTVSVSITGTAANTTLPHTHGTSGVTVSTPTEDINLILQGTGGAVNVAGNNHRHTLSGLTGDSGTGTNHGHSVTGSGSGTASFQPRYARGILMKLAV